MQGIKNPILKHKEYNIGIKIDRKIAEKDDFFMHYFMGKHQGWSGRPYRRGVNRCHYCGAPSDAPDNPNWRKETREGLAAKAFKVAFCY